MLFGEFRATRFHLLSIKGKITERLGQFWKILKTLVQLILNSTWPHVITYTNRIGFDTVSPFVYTAPVEFVIRTGSFRKRFQKWSVFKTIRFHWSCKRRNRIDLKTVTYFGAKLAGFFVNTP